MRLLFLILAHDRPGQSLELARALTAAAADGCALIHYDARAPEAEFAILRQGVEAEPRIGLVTQRKACPWGGFGLVEASLAALAQMEAEAIPADRVILLSGSCLPCRPISQLERYLAEYPEREFIESEDESWIVGGLRAERYSLYHLLKDPRKHPKLERWLVQVQRRLGVRRRVPKGLSPRFGSQWWALTGETCRKILAEIRANPERLRFFSRVWIPDEMVFQTYVNALVPREHIAGFSLTHFQFTEKGKPVVLHDDHTDYVLTLPRFFARKAWPAARRLRAALLARAAEADDGAPLDGIGTRRRDYEAKVAAQTWYPVPGQIFYLDQRTDQTDSVLARASEPYIVLVGPPHLTRAVLRHLPEGPFARLGEVFAPGKSDLGEGRESFGGLSPDAAAIRDLHPALFLTRVRARCDGVPVLLWSPEHATFLLERVLHDATALCIACVPFTGDEAYDKRLLTFALRPAVAQSEALPLVDLGLPQGLAMRAGNHVLTPENPVGLDWLMWALFYRDGGSSLPHVVPMAWNPTGGDIDALRRRRCLDAALENCRFAAHNWFPPLVRGLQAAWAPVIEDHLAEWLYPDPAIRARAMARRFAGEHPAALSEKRRLRPQARDLIALEETG